MQGFDGASNRLKGCGEERKKGLLRAGLESFESKTKGSLYSKEPFSVS